MNQYKIQSASIIGSHHRNVNKNNQDAAVVIEKNEIAVGVVADGCGSGAHSEIGARLGALFAANFLVEKVNAETPLLAKGGETSFESVLEQLRVALLAYLEKICVAPNEKKEFVFSHLLFTLVGFVITPACAGRPERVYVFRAGDGVVIVNGEKIVFDENNMPRYLSFGMLSANNGDEGRRFNFEIVKEMPTADLHCLLIATDGFVPILENGEQEFTSLGETKTVGAFIDLTNEKYLSNRCFLQKRLNVLGMNQGLLYDDTTAILVRKQDEQDKQDK